MQRKTNQWKWLKVFFSLGVIVTTSCASTANAVTPSNNNSTSTPNPSQPINPTEPIQPAPEQKPVQPIEPSSKPEQKLPETTEQPTIPEPSPPTEIVKPPTTPKEPEESTPAKPSDSNPSNPPSENSTHQPTSPNSSETDSDKNNEPQKPTTPNVITEKNGVKIYHSYNDFANKNLGFIHQNFYAQKAANNYIKNYRLHQTIDQEYWKFNEAKQEFSWSINYSLINDVIKTDSSASEIKLWLFLDIRESKSEIDGTIVPLKDYVNFHTDSSNTVAKLKHSVGIEFALNDLLNQKKLEVSSLKNENIHINYNEQSKVIDFKILPKEDGAQKFTDNYLKALKENKLYFSNFNNFLNLSFKSSNDQNTTLGHWRTPSQYASFDFKKYLANNKSSTYASSFEDKASLYDPANPWKTNVNAYDKSTRERLTFENISQKKYENTYIDNMQLIARYNDFKLAEEMRVRTYRSGERNENGTLTMFAKVKPSDVNDHRYYVMTNKHVTASGKGFHFSKISNNYFLNSKSIIMYPPNAIEPSDGDLGMGTFWSPGSFRSFFNEVVPNRKIVNGSGTSLAYVKDISVGILDTKILIQTINKQMWKYNTEEKKQWNAIIDDLKQWPNLPPLKFTNKYSNLFSFDSQALVNWYINGYSSKSYINYKINRINFDHTQRNQSNSKNIARFANDVNFMPDSGDQSLIYNGSSGSLIVDQNQTVVGIYWGRQTIGAVSKHSIQLFYSSDYDIIGSNVDGSNPADNINEHTFCHRVINAVKNDNSKFELLPMCAPPSK